MSNENGKCAAVGAKAGGQGDAGSEKDLLLARFQTAHAKDVSNNVRHWWVIYLDQSGRNLAGEGSTEAEAWRTALAFIEHEDLRPIATAAANAAAPAAPEQKGKA